MARILNCFHYSFEFHDTSIPWACTKICTKIFQNCVFIKPFRRRDFHLMYEFHL